jgi:hypothetical protein
MEETAKSVLVSTKETDYLDEDKPIRGQNYVLLSFLSPEDVIVKKDLYFLSKFIDKFGKDMTDLFQGIKEKFPESEDMINNIKENHSYIFDPKEMNEQYTFYKSVNNEELEQSYHRDNNFVTSMRGIKVRGTFDTLDEAKNRSEFLKKIDSKFNIYIAQVGCWCPWSPNPECLENQEYSETQLNTLMKEYKKNMDDKDVIFEERKNKVASNVAPGGSDSDKDNNIELDSLKSSIENVDVWSERQK